MFNVGDRVVYVGEDYLFDTYEVEVDGLAHGKVIGITNNPLISDTPMYFVAFDCQENSLCCYVEELRREEAAKETEPVTP